METSSSIAKIAAALKKFQASGVKVGKDATNPHFRSKFASLENVIDTTRDALEEEGLSFAQFPDGDGLTTILMHESGEWIKATAHLMADKQTPQGQGSAITYMRRYALSAALGLATEDDDDGNEASKPRPPVAAKKAPTSAAAPKDEGLTDKMQIMTLMAQLGQDLTKMNKDQAAKAVLNATGYELDESNFAQIIFTLEEKIAASQK